MANLATLLVIDEVAASFTSSVCSMTLFRSRMWSRPACTVLSRLKFRLAFVVETATGVLPAIWTANAIASFRQASGESATLETNPLVRASFASK